MPQGFVSTVGATRAHDPRPSHAARRLTAAPAVVVFDGAAALPDAVTDPAGAARAERPGRDPARQRHDPGHVRELHGAVKPRQTARTVVIQALKAGKWVKLGKARLTRRSTFKLVKKMAKGSYKVRARRAANRFYFAGVSATKTLRVR